MPSIQPKSTILTIYPITKSNVLESTLYVKIIKIYKKYKCNRSKINIHYA